MDSTTEQSCWHCGVVLVPERLRCENCPTECDVEGCQEMGCSESDSTTGVEKERQPLRWQDEFQGTIGCLIRHDHSLRPDRTTVYAFGVTAETGREWCEAINSYDSLRSQVARLERNLKEIQGEWSVMARMCGNWRSFISNAGDGEYQSLLKDSMVVTEANIELRSQNAALKAWQMDVEEREAAVCPEDVPFDEYIRHLESKLKVALESKQ